MSKKSEAADKPAKFKLVGYVMTTEELQGWLDKTLTAVSGAAVLSNDSSREVARHALKSLFSLTGNDRDASLQAVQKIDDFSVRRRLMEVFRRSYIETTAPFTSEIFFQTGSFTNPDFTDIFDRDLLYLWRHAGKDIVKFETLIKTYPNASRIRLNKRLRSQAFKRKQRVQYVVGRSFANSNGVSTTTNILALLIFIAFIVMMFR